MDTRKYTEIPDFHIKKYVKNACIASELAYVDPDIFFLKWQNAKNVGTLNLKNSHDVREDSIQKLFSKVTERPTFYDGSTNLSVNKDAQAYLIRKNNTIYVVFRGTQQISDILSNFDFRLKKLEEGGAAKVHRGFYYQFKSIKDDLFKDLSALIESMPNIKRIVVCGHSLGASIATIAAVAISKCFKIKVNCVTFGSPRVGNKSFVDLFKNSGITNWRFITKDDPIPLLSSFCNYYHVGSAYCINDTCVLKEDGDIHWILRILYSFCKPFYMHSMSTYLKFLVNL